MMPWTQAFSEIARDDIARIVLPEMGFDLNGPVWATLVDLDGNELAPRRVCRNIGIAKWTTLSIPLDGPAMVYSAFSHQPAGPLVLSREPVLVPKVGCTVNVTPKFEIVIESA